MADVLTYVRLRWTLTTSKINRLQTYFGHTPALAGWRAEHVHTLEEILKEIRARHENSGKILLFW